MAKLQGQFVDLQASCGCLKGQYADGWRIDQGTDYPYHTGGAVLLFGVTSRILDAFGRKWWQRGCPGGRPRSTFRHHVAKWEIMGTALCRHHPMIFVRPTFVWQHKRRTSEGSVASDIENLAKPVLPNTDVGIDMQWGNNTTFLQQTMPCSRIHACIAECVPCKLLLPFIAYLLPWRNRSRGSLIHTPGQGCGACSSSHHQTSVPSPL
eukprot:1160890-Pelagomonas_calceolata.AAC.10